MKLYSDIITSHDIYAATAYVEGVVVDSSGVRRFTSRNGVSAYEFFLEGLDDRHVRARNQRDGHAATWDDWGIVIARLFALDPQAVIGQYKGEQDFFEQTRRWRGENRAPWLLEDVSSPYVWPDAEQIEEDSSRAVRREKKEIRRRIAFMERMHARLG